MSDEKKGVIAAMLLMPLMVLSLLGCAGLVQMHEDSLSSVFLRMKFREPRSDGSVGTSYGVVFRMGKHAITAAHLLEGGVEVPDGWTPIMTRGDVQWFALDAEAGEVLELRSLERVGWEEGATCSAAGKGGILLRNGYAFIPEAAQGDSGAPILIRDGKVVGVLSALGFDGTRFTGLVIVEVL